MCCRSRRIERDGWAGDDDDDDDELGTERTDASVVVGAAAASSTAGGTSTDAGIAGAGAGAFFWPLLYAAAVMPYTKP